MTPVSSFFWPLEKDGGAQPRPPSRNQPRTPPRRAPQRGASAAARRGCQQRPAGSRSEATHGAATRRRRLQHAPAPRPSRTRRAPKQHGSAPRPAAADDGWVQQPQLTRTGVERRSAAASQRRRLRGEQRSAFGAGARMRTAATSRRCHLSSCGQIEAHRAGAALAGRLKLILRQS